MEGAPILIAGAGRMGGALIAGWRAAGMAADQILIRDPAPGDVAQIAVAAGAALNPGDATLARARSVILAVKPAGWREAAAELAPLLAKDAIVVSTLAGVDLAAIQGAFPAHPVARAMPTTAVAIGKGPISVVGADAAARARTIALFAPLGEVVELAGEALMDAATAASGSGPAYVHAFVEALAMAGAAAGLPRAAAERLARSTLIGAAALLEAGDESPAELRRRVTSPGGTTEAGLSVLSGPDGLEPLMARAVAAALARSLELGGR